MLHLEHLNMAQLIVFIVQDQFQQIKKRWSEDICFKLQSICNIFRRGTRDGIHLNFSP